MSKGHEWIHWQFGSITKLKATVFDLWITMSSLDVVCKLCSLPNQYKLAVYVHVLVCTSSVEEPRKNTLTFSHIDTVNVLGAVIIRG